MSSITLADAQFIDQTQRERVIQIITKRDAGMPLDRLEETLLNGAAKTIEIRKKSLEQSAEFTLRQELHQKEALESDWKVLHAWHQLQVESQPAPIGNTEAKSCNLLCVACTVLLVVGAALLILNGLFILSAALLTISCCMIVMGVGGLGLNCCLK